MIDVIYVDVRGVGQDTRGGEGVVRVHKRVFVERPRSSNLYRLIPNIRIRENGFECGKGVNGRPSLFS